MWRCELCDSYLGLLTAGRLCADCYKIRTITKCYDSNTILTHLENHFLVKQYPVPANSINDVGSPIGDESYETKEEEKKEEKPSKPLTRSEVKAKMREEKITWEEAVKKYGDGTNPPSN